MARTTVGTPAEHPEDVGESAAPDARERPAGARKSASRARRISAVVAGILTCVLVPLSIVTVWLHGTLLDTDQYVATVAPLATNPAIQQAAAHRVALAVVAGTDLRSDIADALPPRASFLAPSIASELQRFVEATALRIIESDQFATIWERANRVAHHQVLAVLEGEGTAVQTKNGRVVVDLGVVVDRVKSRLASLGVDVLDNVDTTRVNREIVLVDSDALRRAQDAVSFFDSLRILLPIVALGVLTLAIVLARDRRRAVLRLSLWLTGILALLVVLLGVARGAYLDALPSTVSRDAAAAVYDQVLHSLLTTMRAGFAFLLVVAVGAWLAGPARAARRTRAGVRALAGRRGDHDEHTDARVAPYARPLQVATIAVALTVLVVLDHPDVTTVLLVGGLALALLLLLQALAPLPREG